MKKIVLAILVLGFFTAYSQDKPNVVIVFMDNFVSEYLGTKSSSGAANRTCDFLKTKSSYKSGPERSLSALRQMVIIYYLIKVSETGHRPNKFLNSPDADHKFEMLSMIGKIQFQI